MPAGGKASSDHGNKVEGVVGQKVSVPILLTCIICYGKISDFKVKDDLGLKPEQNY